MANCKDCLKQDVCNRDVGHGYSVCPCYLSADVVEVVRCKDCDFSVGDFEKLPLNCIHANGLYMPKPNDFCSFGVRKGGVKE